MTSCFEHIFQGYHLLSAHFKDSFSTPVDDPHLDIFRHLTSWCETCRVQDQQQYPLRVDKTHIYSRESTCQPFIRFSIPSEESSTSFYKLPSEKELLCTWYSPSTPLKPSQEEWGLFEQQTNHFLSILQESKLNPLFKHLHQASLFQREFYSFHRSLIGFSKQGFASNVSSFLPFLSSSSQGPVHSFTFQPLCRSIYEPKLQAFVQSCRFFHVDLCGKLLSSSLDKFPPELIPCLQSLLLFKIITSSHLFQSLSSHELYWLTQHKQELESPSFFAFPSPKRSIWWTPLIIRWLLHVFSLQSEETQQVLLLSPFISNLFPIQMTFFHGWYPWQARSMCLHHQNYLRVSQHNQLRSILSLCHPLYFFPTSKQDQTHVFRVSRLHDFFYFSFASRWISSTSLDCSPLSPSWLESHQALLPLFSFLPSKQRMIHCLKTTLETFLLKEERAIAKPTLFFQLFVSCIVKIDWEGLSLTVSCHPFLFDIDQHLELCIPFSIVQCLFEDETFLLYSPHLSFLLYEYFDQSSLSTIEKKQLLDRFKFQTQVRLVN